MPDGFAGGDGFTFEGARVWALDNERFIGKGGEYDETTELWEWYIPARADRLLTTATATGLRFICAKCKAGARRPEISWAKIHPTLEALITAGVTTVSLSRLGAILG